VFYAHSRFLCSLASFKLSTLGVLHPSQQAHTFSALLLFDETFAQPDVFVVVNCSTVALSVLLRCFNAQPYIFAVVNCADLAPSVFYSLVLTSCVVGREPTPFIYFAVK